MENKRITWIDTAKGIGISLVVLGHTALPYTIFRYIFSFHLPLFFFLSGYLFNQEKYPSFWQFLNHKFRKLVVPYFIFSGCLYFYWLLIGKNIEQNLGLSTKFYQPILDIFYSSNHLLTIFTPLWFLTCLFIVEIIFYFLAKLKPLSLMFTILVASIIGFLYTLVSPFHLPWSIDIALMSILFYGAGFLSQNINLNLKKLWLIILAVLCLLLGFLGSIFNSQVDMLIGQYGNYFIFIIVAFLGISLICFLAKIIDNKSLQFLGQNSLYIFAFHQVFLGLGREIWKIVYPNTNIDILGQSTILIGLFLSIFAIICLTLIIKIIDVIKKKPLAS